VSKSLTDQLRDYFDDVDRQQGTVDIDALKRRIEERAIIIELSPELAVPANAPTSERRWPILIAAAAVVAIIGATILAYVLNSDDDQTPAPAATVAPISLAPTTVAASASQSVCINRFGGLCRGRLAAGTYTTSTFEPTITYTVPDGWFNDLDTPGKFELSPVNDDPLSATWSSHGSPSGDTRTIGFYENLAIPNECEQQQPDPSVERTIEAMTAWLTSHPGLVTTEPVEVNVGGLDGVVLDITLDPSWTQGCSFSAGQPVVVILTEGIPGGVVHMIDSGKPERLYLLQQPSGVIAIAVFADEPGQSPEELAAFATPILGNIRFAA
jgi:hypothetical protein